VIIISTITGTASFALESIPLSLRPYAPPLIGFLNLTAGLITTVSQFLKVSSLCEGHRVAAQSFRILSRNISIELMLPADERSSGASKFVQFCREEIERLLESAPDLPVKLTKEFIKKYKGRDFTKPQCLEIPVFEVYSELDNQSYLERLAQEKNDRVNREIEKRDQVKKELSLEILEDKKTRDLECARPETILKSMESLIHKLDPLYTGESKTKTKIKSLGMF
jgi:hypothetical protein